MDIVAQVQYNFKIDEELKDTAEELSKEFSSKQEFLSSMLDSYKQFKQQNLDTDIDMSQYNDIETNTKQVLYEAFKHIIYTIQAHNTNNKQLAISVEQDKIFIEKERESFNQQIADIQATHNEELLKVSAQHKAELQNKETLSQQMSETNKKLSLELTELMRTMESKQKEIEDLKLIAGHTQSISNENTLLRKEIEKVNSALKAQSDATVHQIKELTDLLSIKEKDAYKADMKLESLEKSFETLKIEVENEKAQLNSKELQIRELEKENTILSTKLEMLNVKEEK
jgi:acyl transferase domain-containing protein